MGICLVLIILTPQVYRQYLLSCLDSEEQDVPPKASAILSGENLPLEFYIRVLNNPKESPYLKDYIASLLAKKIVTQSDRDQERILAELNETQVSFWDGKTPKENIPARPLLQQKLSELRAQR